MVIVVNIAVFLIIGLFAFLGSRRGFARTAIEFLGYFLAVSIAFSVAGLISNSVYQNRVRPAVINTLADNMPGRDGYTPDEIDRIWDRLPGTVTMLYDRSQLDYLIGGLNENVEQLTEDTMETVATAISDNVIRPVVVYGLRFIIASILLLILIIAVKIVARVVGKSFNRLPLIGRANRFFGLLIGIIKGVIIVYMIAQLIRWSLPIFGDRIFIFTPELINGIMLFEAFNRINILW